MIRFGVLGPLTVVLDDEPVPLRAALIRRLLAALLCRPGQIVPLDELVGALWGSSPPPSSRKTLQVYVRRLRQLLDDESRIEHHDGGYRINVKPDELDSSSFQELVADAAVALRRGLPDEAGEAYRRALGLWRGTAFEDAVDADAVAVHARLLDEERLRVEVEHIELQMNLGLDGDLIPQLRRLSDAHPYREDLAGRLMTVLYRSGRQTEALEVFHSVRRTLGEDLGIEPGPALQRLQESMLRGDPALAPNRPRPTVPRGLPTPNAGFTGRHAELAALDGLLIENLPAVPVALVTGSGGVGKTALAVRWGHQVADCFPDGQLFIDMQGYATGAPTRPIDALAIFLRALGVSPERIPVDLNEATVVYRSLMTDRRVLIVVDNAHSAADVRSFIPGAPGCLTLVTSRDRLAGLVVREGGRRIPVDLLTPGEAHDLIASLLGMESDLPEVAELAKVCAYLPLALRVAIAQLLDRPHRTLAAQVAKLRSGDRLGHLAVSGDETSAVRTAFALSYDSMPGEAQRMFRHFGLAPCQSFSVAASAALVGITEEEAERALDRLAEAHLIDQVGVDRYGLHDLLRDFARELCLSEELEKDRTCAVVRLLNWYREVVADCHQLAYPSLLSLPREERIAARFADAVSALNWLDVEHRNITRLVQFAVAERYDELTWELADLMRGYYLTRRQMTAWFASARAGLIAARRSGGPEAQAVMYQALGNAYGVINKQRAAAANFRRAIASSRAAGWTRAEIVTLGNLAITHGLRGETSKTEEILLQALKRCRDTHTAAPSAVLNSLSVLYSRIGNPRLAVTYGEQALSIMTPGDTFTTAAMNNAGHLYRLLGRYDEALEVLEKGLSGYRAAGNRHGEIEALAEICELHLDRGQLRLASTFAEAAGQLSRQLNVDHVVVAAVGTMASCQLAAGDPKAARLLLGEMLRRASSLDVQYLLPKLFIGMSSACLLSGEPEDAQVNAERALDLAERVGMPLQKGSALVALARVRVSGNLLDLAVKAATQAVEIQQETGYRLGEAEALAVLSHAHPDPIRAEKHEAAFRAICSAIGANPYWLSAFEFEY